MCIYKAMERMTSREGGWFSKAEKILNWEYNIKKDCLFGGDCIEHMYV